MKILLAVDESDYSLTAAETVATRPWPSGTVVRVLTAIAPDFSFLIIATSGIYLAGC